MAPADLPRGPSASYGYFARPASTAVRQTTHSGQPPIPYRWVGWPQPAHGPTWAGGHTGAGGFWAGARVFTPASYVRATFAPDRSPKQTPKCPRHLP
jgi:hypothetical protein